MTLVRWRSPFDAFAAMERDFDDLLSRVLSARPASREGGMASWRPRTEAFRDGDHFVVRAELPGIDPEKDVEVNLDGNVLRISGERSFDRKIDEKDRFLSERYFGSFSREFILPDGIDPESLEASYDDGVLTVTMPVPATLEATSRRIPIASGGVVDVEEKSN